MSGGPNNRPIIPIEETAAIATGGGRILDLPAALKTNGTAGETPIPTIRSPIVAGITYGNTTAITNPVAVQRPHKAIIFLNPILCVSQSVMNRIIVIEIINAV